MSDKRWLDNNPKDEWGSMKSNPKQPDWKETKSVEPKADRQENLLNKVRDIIRRNKP